MTIRERVKALLYARQSAELQGVSSLRPAPAAEDLRLRRQRRQGQEAQAPERRRAEGAAFSSPGAARLPGVSSEHAPSWPPPAGEAPVWPPPAARPAPVDDVVGTPLAEGEGVTYRIRLLNPEQGLDRVIDAFEGENLLDAAARVGLDLPFSCLNGGCFSCAARLLEGSLEMGDQYMLDPTQVEVGYRLLCCSLPHTPCTILTHQAGNVS